MPTLQNTIRLIDLGCVPAWQTQAPYHAVAESMTADTPDTIIVCQPQEPYLCLGYHQVFDTVLDRAECERRKLPVMRRRVGGGATYLDHNQLFYQYIFHHSHLPAMFQAVYTTLLAAPVATLQQLGLNAELRAVNEIEVDGRRIAGIGGGRIGDACVVVGNLLFDFDFETMSHVWYAPWPSYRELATKALQERVITLRQTQSNADMEKVQSLLIEQFSDTFQQPLSLGKLTDQEWRNAERIAQRMTSTDYLNLHQEHAVLNKPRPLKIAADVYIHALSIEHQDQTLYGSFRVENAIIEQARLHSDCGSDWHQAEANLMGCTFSSATEKSGIWSKLR